MTGVVVTEGPESGICNICGEDGPLTVDHTPPKGWVRPKRVELQHIVRELSPEGLPRVKRTFSQNGVKYRTLCGRCNNSLLGHAYDPHLIAFANQTARLLRTRFRLPPQLNVPARPQAIMRSVIGHIAAQGVDRYRKGPNTEHIRDYLLDSTLPLPSCLTMYYWAYPFRSQVLARDSAFSRLDIQQTFMTWFIKCFPLAFMVAWDADPQLPVRVHSLSSWRNTSYDTESELPIRLRPLLSETWPETPTDISFMTYGAEAISAIDWR